MCEAAEKRAAQLLYEALPFSAQTAHTYGLINEVYSSSQFEQALAKKIAHLVEQPSLALCATKRLLRQRAHALLEEVFQEEATLFLQHLQSPEFFEAVQRFMSKKKGNEEST